MVLREEAGPNVNVPVHKLSCCAAAAGAVSGMGLQAQSHWRGVPRKLDCRPCCGSCRCDVLHTQVGLNGSLPLLLHVADHVLNVLSQLAVE